MASSLRGPSPPLDGAQANKDRVSGNPDKSPIPAQATGGGNPILHDTVTGFPLMPEMDRVPGIPSQAEGVVPKVEDANSMENGDNRALIPAVDSRENSIQWARSEVDSSLSRSPSSEQLRHEETKKWVHDPSGPGFLYGRGDAVALPSRSAKNVSDMESFGVGAPPTVSPVRYPGHIVVDDKGSSP
ncbi:hypothetical protein B0T26DRAFT_745837 [Lasiosphaeria miniovina]|uniref:Uncharacterized protein n=1 Tax=Lasiosphaeria miniovina TaxID=1954250 RepID=A0AA40EFZ8_9PEZI|nr:uncharacterized protein B0T26DRAFT_745837 [Lasiosphaeria miniovina]KAK0733848.1 hypothetical protein B0T26DRAFT_745837 [Lasiosphaeria miniovina]